MIAAKRSKKPAKLRKLNKTSAKAQSPDAHKLAPLVEFLNQDPLDPRLAEKISGELNSILYGRGHHNADTLKWVHDTVVQAVLPFAEPPGNRAAPEDKHAATERLLDHLTKLIYKINRLDFRPRFILLPGEPRVRVNNSNVFRLAVRKFRPKQRRAHLWGRQVRNPARDLLGAEQGILEWLDGQWIVKMDFDPNFSKNPPLIDFYGMIAEGLLTGGIARVRRCPHCRVFFVAVENRERFCKRQHSREYHDDPIRAKARVALSRHNKEQTRN